MKNILFLLVFIPIVSFGQNPVSDKFISKYRNGFEIPYFKRVNIHYTAKQFFTNEEEVDFSSITERYGRLKKNAYFFYDSNVFRDNAMIAIIQSEEDEADVGHNNPMSTVFKTPENAFQFIFIKSDKTPLSMKLDFIVNNNLYAANGTKLYPGREFINENFSAKFIFDDDPSTLIELKKDNFFNKFNEINDNDKLILSLKKYSYVDIMLEYDRKDRRYKYAKYNFKTKSREDDNPPPFAVAEVKRGVYTIYVGNWSVSRKRKHYLRTSLKGSSEALNKIIKGAQTSKKNQFEYIYNMGMANMNPFDYEGYIHTFLEDAKNNHGLNLDYVKNAMLTVSKRLEDNTIAVSLASDDDNSVVIAIDPERWQKASQRKRWYIIYHELGHDILNLEHGECGAMMNEYAKPDYTWSELERDKTTMFESYKRLKQN